MTTQSLAVATASEMAGFEVRSLVRLDGYLGSSGGVDDLRFARSWH